MSENSKPEHTDAPDSTGTTDSTADAETNNAPETSTAPEAASPEEVPASTVGNGDPAAVPGDVPAAAEEEYVLVKTWRKKWVDPIVDGILVLLSVVAVGALALHIMVAFFGFSLYSFSSGSMQPTITIGSVSLAQEIDDPSTIEEGDIITVSHPTQDVPLTHRVTGVNREESIEQAIDESVIYGIVEGESDFLYKLTRGAFGESTERELDYNVAEEDVEAGNVVVLNMQGDDNDNEDPRVYAVGPDSADAYIAHIPGAGHVMNWVSGNFWWLLTGMGVILLYVIFPFEDYRRVRKDTVKTDAVSG